MPSRFLKWQSQITYMQLKGGMNIPMCRLGMICRWCSAEGLMSVNTAYASFYRKP